MSTWYAAHTLEYARFLDGVQETYSVYENVILIKADTLDDAHQEAERFARAEAEASDVIIDGRIARPTYAGIRKLVKCQDMVAADFERVNEPFHPMHGTELKMCIRDRV